MRQGTPSIWRDTRAEADEIATRPGTIRWSVEHFDHVWRVCMGDQYIFTTPDHLGGRFLFGMAAHMVFRNQSDRSN